MSKKKNPNDFTSEDAAKVTQRRLAAIGAARVVYEFAEKLNEDRDRIRRSKAFITTLINGGDQSNWGAVAKALELAEEALEQADMHIGWLQDVASKESQEAAGLPAAVPEATERARRILMDLNPTERDWWLAAGVSMLEAKAKDAAAE